MDKTKSQVMTDNFPIQFTPRAVEMAKDALEQCNKEDGEYLRISVCGGGCAGLQYGLNFDSSIDEMDLLIEINGLKIVTDVFTSVQIPGTTVDYQETLQGAGFKFENPTARRSCGCGSSFSA